MLRKETGSQMIKIFALISTKNVKHYLSKSIDPRVCHRHGSSSSVVLGTTIVRWNMKGALALIYLRVFQILRGIPIQPMHQATRVEAVQCPFLNGRLSKRKENECSPSALLVKWLDSTFSQVSISEPIPVHWD